MNTNVLHPAILKETSKTPSFLNLEIENHEGIRTAVVFRLSRFFKRRFRTSIARNWDMYTLKDPIPSLSCPDFCNNKIYDQTVYGGNLKRRKNPSMTELDTNVE